MKTLELNCFLWYRNKYPPSKGTQGGVRVWGYPERKTDVIFGIFTNENLRIDISHAFFWRGLSPPPYPLRATFGGVWGDPKRKNDIIFEIPTIENPKIDISYVIL